MRENAFFIPALGITLFVFLFILFLGVVIPQFDYFDKSIHRLDADEVLLTFDDGPNPETTLKILNTLKENQVGALFFVIGKQIEKHPEVAKKIISDGHLIGNHTYSHPIFFALFSKEKIIAEIEAGFKVIEEKLQIKTKLFRIPVGYNNPLIAQTTKELQLKTIGWKARSFDTLIHNSESLLKRLLKISKPGRIILLHDNLHQTAEVLDGYIKQAKANGIKFVSPDNLKQRLNV